MKLCYFLGADNALFAELSATMTLFEQVREYKWDNLWIVSDSKTVVKAFTNNNIVSLKIRTKWLNCVPITLDMNSLIIHISKEANSYANSLATIGFMFRSNN